MNADEDYGFDIAGFLHLKQVLTAEEVETWRQAIDAVAGEGGQIEGPTQSNGMLKGYLDALCGSDYAVETPPRLVAGSDVADGRAKFTAGDPENNRRLRYVCHGDVLVCAATTLNGIRGQPGLLIEVEYISAGVMPAAGFPEVEAPDWAADPRPACGITIGKGRRRRHHGYAGKYTGRGSAAYTSFLNPTAIPFS